MINIITCDFSKTVMVFKQAWQYDYGQKVRLIGKHIKEGMTIQWTYADLEGVDSREIKKVNGDLLANIPNDSLKQENNVKGYIYYFDAKKGQTLYKIELKVRNRVTTDEYTSPDDIPIYQQLIIDTTAAKDAAEAAALNANTVAGEVEAAELLRVAAEDARVTAEDARVLAEDGRVTAEQAREVAEGLREQGETDRNTAYGLAETARDNQYSAQEIVRDGLYSTAETGRDNQYSAQETARDGLYDTAEEVRDGLYTTAEGARDTAYGVAEGARDDLYDIAEGARDDLYDIAENARDAQLNEVEGRVDDLEDKNIITDTVTSDQYEYTGATITNGFLTLNFEEVV